LLEPPGHQIYSFSGYYRRVSGAKMFPNRINPETEVLRCFELSFKARFYATLVGFAVLPC
jgi:hypothetical protein